ncbi:hypothetical protein RSal33209_0132 [Renibacterium salmoninarum ATCC 33209]|uniref:Uncharacterized protein n=1 Tax=Renibacterium salmoninarum (strain ATCC 33209 / DSM 20767 / JCM 11484 / NBRC 15589 / NCIMB 2235) TaxID=288705 RepID=A9WL55_RENSM|nr:hypothetical protein RSal33209_0132 [Renibacterium salmoninarum ATCC 33209]
MFDICSPLTLLLVGWFVSEGRAALGHIPIFCLYRSGALHTRVRLSWTGIPGRPPNLDQKLAHPRTSRAVAAFGNGTACLSLYVSARCRAAVKTMPERGSVERAEMAFAGALW